MLATGGDDVGRLGLLHAAYGPGTTALLQRIGLRDGMRVVEVGCGSGNIACWAAERVGPTGSVVGIDNSPAQIEQARKQAEARGLRNVEFRVADAYAPGLPDGTFDVAYCRLVLIHLTDPPAGLKAMRDLVRPGGTVACEEMESGVWACDPPADCVRRFFDLTIALGEKNGENFRLGGSLPRLFRAAGFARPEVGTNFPAAVRGPEKRLLGLTFAEYAAEMVREGLVARAEADRITAELMALADDDTTLLVFPLIMQVWATS